MPSLYTSIAIYAPRHRVWQAIVQKQHWKYWNTFLYDNDPGRSLRQGEDVLLALRRSRGDEETEFQAQITLLQPEQCLRWVSKIPGFMQEQVFELQDIDHDCIRYLHQETFSGPLARVIFPFIRQDEQQGIRRMAQELKDYAEQQRQRKSLR